VSLLVLLLTGCGQQAGAWRLISPAGTHTYSVATDPHIPQLIYAGSDQGVYLARADQTGLAVETSGIPDQTVVASILPDSKIAGLIFAGTTRGLYRSVNYGETWARYGQALPSDSAALVLAGEPDDSVLLAGMDGAGVYRSQDDGATWTLSSSGLPAKATVAALAWDAASKQWWAGLNATSGHTLYASADGGATWSTADAGLPSGASVNALLTLNSGSGVIRLAATTVGLYAERGGAATWTKLSAGLPSGGSLALAPISGQPDAVVAAIGSGVYLSTNAGTSWALVAQGLTSNVAGLTVASDAHGKSVYYAASDQLARYPNTVPPNDPLAFLIVALVVIVLVVGGYFLMRRNRRFGYAMGANDNEATAGPGAAAERARRRQEDGETPTGPYFPAHEDDVWRARVPSGKPRASVLSPADLTTREQTGQPAPPNKAAQNGHGDKQSKR
jgi:hypothetical protein